MKDALDPVKIGNRFRERREDLGITQKDLAQLMKKQGLRGYSQQNLVTLEKGGIQDPRQHAADLAESLRTTPEWLIYAKGERDIGPRPMTAAEYEQLPLDLQLDLTRIAAEYRKKRKRA